MPIVTKTLALPLVLALLSPANAFAQRREVTAHGSNQIFWATSIEKGTGANATEQSKLLSRQIMDKGEWQALAPLPARILSISSQGQDLSAEAIVLLENNVPNAGAERLWAWFSAPTFVKGELRSAGRYSYGPVLPRGAKPLAIAGGKNQRLLWAIGRNLATPASATRSTTIPSATRPAPEIIQPNLTLFFLDGREWTPVEVFWPRELDDDQDVIPLIVLNNLPVIAAIANGHIRIYELDREGRNWRQTHTVQVQPAPRYVKLLNLAERPALWIQSQDAGVVGDIWTPDGTFRLSFTNSGPIPSANDMDVTFAGDELRLVFRRDNELYEKSYGRGGSENPAGLAKINASNRTTQPPIQWVTTAIMAVFTVLIISTLLRRRAADREESRDREKDRDDE